jgi:hypothetical protein
LGELENPHEFWMFQDLPILRCCDKVVLLQLEGWEESCGVQKELEMAKTLNIPVVVIGGDEMDSFFHSKAMLEFRLEMLRKRRRERAMLDTDI